MIKHLVLSAALVVAPLLHADSAPDAAQTEPGKIQVLSDFKGVIFLDGERLSRKVTAKHDRFYTIWDQTPGVHHLRLWNSNHLQVEGDLAVQAGKATYVHIRSGGLEVTQAPMALTKPNRTWVAVLAVGAAASVGLAVWGVVSLIQGVQQMNSQPGGCG
jgi:hypothetical protein